MPPRYSYWTILAGGLPTSFRAADRDDLLPTFRRLQERHPDAEMKWFQRGKLWQSPEDAKNALEKKEAPRGRDWRPGGEHRDLREGFRKKKQERNQARRQARFDRKHGDADVPATERRRRPPETRTTSTRPPAKRPFSRQPSKRRSR